MMMNLTNTIYCDNIFTYLSYSEVLQFLRTNRFIYDSLIDQSRQIHLNEKTLIRFIQDANYREKIYGSIVDPSKQLILAFKVQPILIRVEGEDKLKHYLETLKLLPPFSVFAQLEHFPPFLELRCNYQMFLFICETFPDFRVRRFKCIHHVFNSESIVPFLTPHLNKVLEEMELRDWNYDIPPLSPTLSVLKLQESKPRSIVPSPGFRILRFEGGKHCDLSQLPYLQLLEIQYDDNLDLESLPPCRKLILRSCTLAKKPADEVLQRFKYLEIDRLEYMNEFPMMFPYITSLVVSVGIFSRDMKVMPCLSLFPRLKTLKINCDYSSFCQESAPTSLRFVEILGLKGYDTGLQVFKNVYEIFIQGRLGSISLEGLEHVPRVILQDIENENLNGLGQNDSVQVVGCRQLKNFSAIKYVREVHIESCPGLTNAEDLSDVHTLAIVDCANLVDVSSLMNVQNLDLKSCHAITSVSSIENVPHLKVTDCKGLKSPLPSIFGVDLGVRVIDDRLTRLPDCLYREICDYLHSKDQFQMICCNTYLYQKLIKHQPLFLIKGDRKGFFSSQSYRESILKRMEDPSKQLIIKFYAKCYFPFEGEHNPGACKEWYSPMMNFIVFVFQNPDAIHKIDTLCLKKGTVQQYFADCLKDKVVDRLSLTASTILTNAQLPSGLKMLTLDRCKIHGNIAPMPSVSCLQLERCQILSASTSSFDLCATFPNLQELYLETSYLDHLQDDAFPMHLISSLNRIKKLILKNCYQMISYLELLQENEEIILLTDFLRFNQYLCSKSFSKSRRITLISNQSIKIELNFTFYENVEMFTLHDPDSSDIVTTWQGNDVDRDVADDRFDCSVDHVKVDDTIVPRNHLPPKLRILKLEGIADWHSLFPSWVKINFDQLSTLQLKDCRNLRSLQGFGQIRNVHFEYLSDLQSLEGLTASNEFVQLHHLPMTITDFTPLQGSRKVVIRDCGGLSDARPLSNTTFLVIRGCHNLMDVSMLGNVSHLELLKCANIYDIEGLKHVKELIVEDCVFLSDLNNSHLSPWFDESGRLRDVASYPLLSYPETNSDRSESEIEDESEEEEEEDSESDDDEDDFEDSDDFADSDDAEDQSEDDEENGD